MTEIYRLSRVEQPYNQLMVCHAVCWVRVTGSSEIPISLSALRDAFVAVSRFHPLLGARRSPEDLSVLVVPNTTLALPLPVFSHDGDSDAAWEFLASRIRDGSWSSEFMWQIDAFLGSRGGPVLVLHFNHSVVDGVSVCAALRTLLGCLNHETTQKTNEPSRVIIPRPFEERFPEFRVTDTLSDSDWRRLCGETREKMAECATRFEVIVQHHWFGQEETRRIVGEAKLHGVSVTSLILAAFAKAGDCTSLSTTIPFNLRHSDADQQVAYSISSLPMSCTFERKATLWEYADCVARAIAESTRSGRANQGCGDWIKWMPPPLVDHETDPSQSRVVLSNLGVVDDKLPRQSDIRGDEWTISEFLPCGGNNRIPGYPVVWCLTHLGRLRLISINFSPPISATAFENHFRDVISSLLSISNSH